MGPIDLPPAQYDHPFAGPLSVEVMDWSKVAGRCGLRGVKACAWRVLVLAPDGKSVKWSCHVVYPRIALSWLDFDGVSPEDEVELIRHETGHCNGWPNDHPDNRFPTNEEDPTS